MNISHSNSNPLTTGAVRFLRAAPRLVRTAVVFAAAACVPALETASGQCVRPMQILADHKVSADNPTTQIVSQNREPLNVKSFRVLLSDRDGFFDAAEPWGTMTVGQRRRQILLEVLEDLWWTLPQMQRPELDSQRVIIDLIAVQGENAVVGGWSEPLFLVNPELKTMVADPAAHQLITTGVDPLQDLGTSPGFHGRITLNTRVPFGLNTATSESDKVSLYGVILHEVLHLLGVASLIGQKCAEGGSLYLEKIISRWDGLMMLRSFERLAAVTCDEIRVTMPSDARGPSGVMFNDVKLVRGLLPVAYDSMGTGCIMDLSHFASSDDSMPAVMMPSIRPGQAVRGLTAFDASALMLLGYTVSGYYGTPGSGRFYPLAPFRTAQVRLTRRDTITIPFGGAVKVPLSVFAGASAEQDTLRCLAAERSDIALEFNSSNDTITILGTGNPLEGGWLAQTWSRADIVAGTQRIRVLYEDSRPLEYVPCPPNQLCNGGFEVVSRLGSTGRPDYVCGISSTMAYWRMDNESVDAYIVSPVRLLKIADTEDRYTANYSIPGGDGYLSPVRPFPRGTIHGEDNRVYIGMINSPNPGGTWDFQEGVSQDISIESNEGGSWYLLECWSYAPERFSPYLLNAALRLIITDTSECGWDTCTPSPQAILDTVIVLPEANQWVQLRSVPVFLPTGRHRVRVTSTGCFSAIPDLYRKGLTVYLYADDMKLISADGLWHSYADPMTPCFDEPFTIQSRFSKGIDTPAVLRTKVLARTPGVEILNNEASANGLTEVGLLLTHELTVSSGNNVPGIASVDIERTAVFKDREIRDTVRLRIAMGAGVVALSELAVKRMIASIEGSVTITNLTSSPSTFTGSVLWKNGASARGPQGFYIEPGTLDVTNRETGMKLSDDARAADRMTYVPFIINISANASSELLIRGSYPFPDSLDDEQYLRIVIDGTGSQCQAVAGARLLSDDTVNPASPDIRVYPQPSQDVVHVEVQAMDKGLRAVIMYDYFGRRITEPATLSDLVFRKYSFSGSMDVANLSTGVYYLFMQGEANSYRTKIIVAR